MFLPLKGLKTPIFDADLRAMTDILFYHLLAKPLENVLPDLLEKSLARGWRAVVHSGNERRIEALNDALWTYRDESFLPHGTKADGSATEQPIWLTSDSDNPNGAQIRFLIDGATVDDVSSYERIVYMFDGNDPDALHHARGQWKAEKEAGHDVTYWAQNEAGRWEKKA